MPRICDIRHGERVRVIATGQETNVITIRQVYRPGERDEAQYLLGKVSKDKRWIYLLKPVAVAWRSEIERV